VFPVLFTTGMKTTLGDDAPVSRLINEKREIANSDSSIFPLFSSINDVFHCGVRSTHPFLVPLIPGGRGADVIGDNQPD
jgi:hypothetical protein